MGGDDVFERSVKDVVSPSGHVGGFVVGDLVRGECLEPRAVFCWDGDKVVWCVDGVCKRGGLVECLLEVLVCRRVWCRGIAGGVGGGEDCLIVIELTLAGVVCIEDTGVEVFEVF